MSIYIQLFILLWQSNHVIIGNKTFFESVLWIFLMFQGVLKMLKLLTITLFSLLWKFCQKLLIWVDIHKFVGSTWKGISIVNKFFLFCKAIYVTHTKVYSNNRYSLTSEATYVYRTEKLSAVFLLLVDHSLFEVLLMNSNGCSICLCWHHCPPPIKQTSKQSWLFWNACSLLAKWLYLMCNHKRGTGHACNYVFHSLLTHLFNTVYILGRNPKFSLARNNYNTHSTIIFNKS